MRLVLDREQRAFADSLEALLTGADTPSVVREWSRGEHGSGRALWVRLAAAGVFALAAPEEYDGVGVRPVELAVAFMALGRHAVPGPLVETVTAAVLLPTPDLVKRLVSGEDMATVAYDSPYALDGDAADLRLVLTPDGLHRATGHGPVRLSLDPARRLTALAPDELLTATPPIEQALLLARLTTAAQALGVGLALLDRTVCYVKQRTQFGAPIGVFQAVKHQLADAKIALEFAAPRVRSRADPGPRRRRRRQGHGVRGGVRHRPHRAPAARRDRLHGGVRPVPVADQGPRPAHGLGQPGAVQRHRPQW